MKEKDQKEQKNLVDWRSALFGGHRVSCMHACDCSCHDSKENRIVHIKACCFVCSECKGRVVDYEDHLKKCHNKPVK